MKTYFYKDRKFVVYLYNKIGEEIASTLYNNELQSFLDGIGNNKEIQWDFWAISPCVGKIEVIINTNFSNLICKQTYIRNNHKTNLIGDKVYFTKICKQ